jgi:hypothetical protein
VTNLGHKAAPFSKVSDMAVIDKNFVKEDVLFDAYKFAKNAFENNIGINFCFSLEISKDGFRLCAIFT